MISSWTNQPQIVPKSVYQPYWLHEVPFSQGQAEKYLVHGMGRSYGDVCLSRESIILSGNLNRIMSYDRKKGVIECEAGITLAEILKIIVPDSWFLPVSPGTQFVSLGGALANDIHGKNHHRAGTFGRHCLSLELIRSNGETIICSLRENSDLFKYTIGGLGLTGIISKATIQLKPINSPDMAVEKFVFKSIYEYLDLSKEYDDKNEYTVAWIDCFASGRDIGRGVYWAGNHDDSKKNDREAKQNLPKHLKKGLLNDLFTVNSSGFKNFLQVPFFYHHLL